MLHAIYQSEQSKQGTEVPLSKNWEPASLGQENRAATPASISTVESVGHNCSMHENGVNVFISPS